MEEQQSENQPTGGRPGNATPAPVVASQGTPPQSTCDARGLAPAANRIADSAGSLLKIFSEDRLSSPRQKLWGFAKTALVFLSLVVGGGFGLEQYLASQHAAAQAQTETLLASASEALVSPHAALRANAVRTLAQVGQIPTYTVQPGTGSLGRHLWAGLVGYAPEYPFFGRSWLLFRDFATAAREPQDNLVSSALLREGAAWEHRIRARGSVAAGWAGGSLLYRAKLAGAQSMDLDLQGIQFGAVDLTGADLTGSNCSTCGLLGATLSKAILRSVILEAGYLAEATITEADLSFARMDRAVLRKVDARRATFTQTVLSDADLTESRLDGATFSQATLRNTVFDRATLRGTLFLQTDVSSATFHEADVGGADFTRAVGFSESLLSTSRNADKAHRPATSKGGSK